MPAVVYSGTSRDVDLHQMGLRVSNRHEEIDRVNAAFNEFADEHAVPAELRRKFNLVFDELLNNIISYAYDDEDEHQIDVHIRLSDAGLSVTVTDDGSHSIRSNVRRPTRPFRSRTGRLAVSEFTSSGT